MNDPTPQTLSFFDDNERFNHLIGVLIALVTVLTAVAALLQGDAGARSDQAKRNAYQSAIQAMGQRLSGEVHSYYDWSQAYQAWSELDLLALSAENLGDEAAAQRYRTVRDRLATLSQLLTPTCNPDSEQPSASLVSTSAKPQAEAASLPCPKLGDKPLTEPYFDSTAGTGPDVRGYDADTFLIETTALAERFAASAALDDAWGGKENTYIVHLTILAVSLFLFGLATTVSGLPRRLFTGVGLVIVIVTVIWMVSVFLRPVPELPEPAIQAYANGFGLAYREKPEEAIAAFDQALAAAPDYANALYERASAQLDLGNYQAAAADYEAAQRAGRNDINVAWNLSWSYHLLGRFDDALQMGQQAIALDPNHIWVRLDQGLKFLTAGQVDAAKAEYGMAMELAARQVAEAKANKQEPPTFLWATLDGAALELDSLVDMLDGLEPYTPTPPRETITNPEAVQATAPELINQLKSLAVALEYTGLPPAGQLTAQISPFEFAHEAVYDEEGDLLEYTPAESFPYGTYEVLAVFDYEGMQDGQNLVVKVYTDGVEDPTWRWVEQWDLGPAGEGGYLPLSFDYSNVFVFSPGEYAVEMYVDNHLAQRGWFIIEPDE